MNSEPALIVGVLQALIALAVAFGLQLTADQIAAIMGLIAVIGAFVTRYHVTPVGKT